MTNVLLENFLQKKTQMWISPYDVIEHRHEDNSSLELFGFARVERLIRILAYYL